MRGVGCLLVALLLSSAARGDVLSGVVLNEEGKPAEKATITAAAVFHAPPLRLNTTTDAAGHFEFDLPILRGSERYKLTARWNNQGADTTDVLDKKGDKTAIRGQPLPVVTLRLQTGGRLRGKVLQAEDDRPIAGARLFLDTGEVLTTDAEGMFLVSGLPMTDHSLIPVAPGRVRNYVLFDTSLRPDAELELRLPRGAVIKGKITDKEGQPIAGAYLNRSSSGNALTLNGWNEVCKPDGTYEYGGLSPERLFYSMEATAPSYRSQSVSADVKSGTEVIERNIRLASRQKSGDATNGPDDSKAKKSSPELTELPRRTVKGIVTSEGIPIKGANIRWATFQWDPAVKSAASDEEGEFSLPGVIAARGAALVIAKGYAPRFVTVDEGVEAIDVPLSRGVTYRGVVRGTAGSPVEGAYVIPRTRCLDSGVCNPIWLDERSARTDANGEFTIRALPTEGVTFDILKEGYSEHRDKQLEFGEAPNQIQLAAGGGIRGRVVDHRFDPVRNFKIRMQTPHDIKAGEQSGSFYAGFDWYGVVFTHHDGDFVVSDFNSQCWIRFIVTSPGRGLAVIDRVLSEPLDQLSPADKLTIQLKPFVPLTVKVADAKTGAPCAEAQVALVEDRVRPGQQFTWGYDDLWASRARADASGAAVFAEPACDEGEVLVSAAGLTRKRVSWKDGVKEIKISLEPESALRGEVRLNGKLLSDGYVSLVSPTKDRYSVSLDTLGGRFHFAQLSAGDYEFSITDQNGSSLHSQKVTLKEGESRELPVKIDGPPKQPRDLKQ